MTIDDAVSDATIDFLEHHGVKGMKWGVRNDRGHEGERATNKKITKLDKKYEKTSLSTYFKVYNSMAERLNNGEADKVNNDPRFKDKDLSDWNSPRARQYHDAYSKLATKILNEESAKQLGTNASGTKKWEWTYDVRNQALPTAQIVDVNKVKHADGDSNVIVEWDDNGKIKSIRFPSVQHEDEVEAFLEHFGVKGMKWGRRKDETTGPVEVSTQATPGRKVTAKGGQGQPAHEDAVKAAISKQKAQKSSTDSLSTPELQALVTRMNLEQQYSKLTSGQVNPGKKFVNDLVTGFAKSQAQKIVNEQGGRLLSEAIAKKAK